MSKGTPTRPVRIPAELWDAAKLKAEHDGTTVSDVIREALRQYVGASDPSQETHISAPANQRRPLPT